MPTGHEGLSRRALFVLGSAALVARTIPVAICGGLPAAVAAPVPSLPIVTGGLMPSGIAIRLRQAREEYAAAVEAYRATGDAGPIERARQRIRNKFGYALALEARDEKELGLFREAGALLEQLETDFEELPLSLELKARFARLRQWAEAGGLHALRSRRGRTA